jgi:hypothetical protein
MKLSGSLRFPLVVTSNAVFMALICACSTQSSPGGLPFLSGPSNGSGPLSDQYHKTFRYIGAKQRFRIPQDVTKVKVIARGAAGAGYEPSRGGRINATIPVIPGETLTIVVGGEASGQKGGFNGGGDGGNDHCGYGCPSFGGGGASDVRQGGDRVADRVLVAGGGGGQGGSWPNFVPGGAGGRGGGSTGGSGANGGPSSGYIGGGGGLGGTQRAGGSGGTPSSCDYYDGNFGSYGQLHDGGTGGQGGTYGGTGPGGGGGGGGYYGGGGGGSGSSFQSYCYTGGGGGGGGSSYIEPKATQFHSWQGWKNATTSGLVVISW